MENKEIQKLLDFIAQSTLDEVNIETSELKLSVKRYGAAPVIQQVAAPQVVAAAPAPAAAPAASSAAPAAPAAPAAAPVVAANRVTIKSPMIGTFYRSAGPDSPSFVEIGKEIAKGKTVCIIEAMKLFNEIESEISGKIVEILVENATPVEFDQPLFVVELA
ncbi:acetyl-CoA carboxylase biotin carboxyl carrier protein [Arcicella rosea]|uniref:acetyl-CoA carboxylase biotin carboxyl carrier protein n=1 Tax=Arcicella rosea TaxID=502909 RepID=UPI00345D5FD6